MCIVDGGGGRLCERASRAVTPAVPMQALVLETGEGSRTLRTSRLWQVPTPCL